MEDALRHKHPFFNHSEAEFFIAEEGKKVLGRIAALNNKRANQFRGTRTAFFSFFEVVEDENVALELFQVAFDWARSLGLIKSLVLAA
jgi:hypothetical protein